MKFAAVATEFPVVRTASKNTQKTSEMNFLNHLNILAQQQVELSDEQAAAVAAGMGFFVMISCVMTVIAVFCIVSMWKIFTKANKPGWPAIIPFYNVIVLLEVVGRPAWWLALLIVPGVNLVCGIIVMIDLAKSFGKTVGYGLGLAILSIIFWPMLAFGSAQYQGPAAAQN